MMRRLPILLATMMLILSVPTTANASHSLTVSTNRKPILLSPTQVQVGGLLTCVGAAESGTVGVVLIQPPGGIALSGGGSTGFSCNAGETVSWSLIVNANEFSTFTTGKARFDTFANTSCSDEEVDCPSTGENGALKIKRRHQP